MNETSVINVTSKEELWLNMLSKKNDAELIKEREKLHDDAFKAELQSIINYLVLERRRKEQTNKQLAKQLLKANEEIEELTKEVENYKKEQKKFMNQVANQAIRILEKEEEIHGLKAEMVRKGLLEAATK